MLSKLNCLSSIPMPFYLCYFCRPRRLVYSVPLSIYLVRLQESSDPKASAIPTMANSQKLIDYDDDEISQGSGIQPISRPKAEPPKKVYPATMGFCRSDPATWLVIDDQYFEQHNIRTKLLECTKPMVLQCRPSSEAACVEALGLVADFLIKKHPDEFRRCRISPELDSVEIVRTGEIFKVGAPFYTMEPLEIAARLAIEDFSIFMLNSEGKHVL